MNPSVARVFDKMEDTPDKKRVGRPINPDSKRQKRMLEKEGCTDPSIDLGSGVRGEGEERVKNAKHKTFFINIESPSICDDYEEWWIRRKQKIIDLFENNRFSSIPIQEIYGSIEFRREYTLYMEDPHYHIHIACVLPDNEKMTLLDIRSGIDVCWKNLFISIGLKIPIVNAVDADYPEQAIQYCLKTKKHCTEEERRKYFFHWIKDEVEPIKLFDYLNKMIPQKLFKDKSEWKPVHLEIPSFRYKDERNQYLSKYLIRFARENEMVFIPAAEKWIKKFQDEENVKYYSTIDIFNHLMENIDSKYAYFVAQLQESIGKLPPKTFLHYYLREVENND